MLVSETPVLKNITGFSWKLCIVSNEAIKGLTGNILLYMSQSCYLTLHTHRPMQQAFGKCFRSSLFVCSIIMFFYSNYC